MRLRFVLSFSAILIVPGSMCSAQSTPKVEDATTAVVRAFETHDIVMFGEIHGNKQEYEWLRSLVVTPDFADRVDDIVVESGNSLYQKSVDRYVSGEAIPLEQAQKAWRNLIGAIGYLIVAGTNTTGGYDDLDHRFDSWSPPAVAPLDDGWIGELPAMPVLSGGSILPRPATPNSGPAASPSSPPSPKLKAVADALLYLGPRDSLIAVRMPRAELDGTPYGKEIERRLMIEGIPMNFLFDKDEVPQFSRPEPGGANAPPPLPPPPKNMGAPLPPRPPSQ